MAAQILINGLVLGALYACIAAGFSLVWGVLNVINMLHGSLIVFGAYLTFFAWHVLGIQPLLVLPVVAIILFILGFLLQYILINRVVAAPILTTLTLTFGLDMIAYNIMTVFFTATPRRITLDLGSLEIGSVVVPLDRIIAMVLAVGMTGMLYLVLRHSQIGRAIVAVRMDRVAATMMGIRVNRVYAITFGIGALMAGLAGSIFALVYPINTNLAGALIGKAFVVCVIGGLGSVGGALLGGFVLGIVESLAGNFFGAQNALTMGFLLMLLLLLIKPTGLIGVKGYE